MVSEPGGTPLSGTKAQQSCIRAHGRPPHVPMDSGSTALSNTPAEGSGRDNLAGDQRATRPEQTFFQDDAPMSGISTYQPRAASPVCASNPQILDAWTHAVEEILRFSHWLTQLYVHFQVRVLSAEGRRAGSLSSDTSLIRYPAKTPCITQNPPPEYCRHTYVFTSHFAITLTRCHSQIQLRYSWTLFLHAGL